ncbi:MAG TPA: hypothetical protein VF720_11410 [Candidatus Eisenbacteria bacterium]
MTIASGPTDPASPVSLAGRPRRFTALLAVLGLALVVVATSSCGDDEDDDDGGSRCGTEALPISDHADGPVLTDVALECQGGNFLNLFATVTDPQGSADLEDVDQRLVVYGQSDCKGDVEFEVMDDISESGGEESFGIVITRTGHEALFDQICAAPEWPVEIHLYDKSGHHTFGKAMARVID